MTFNPATLTWKCHICGETRPDAAISVQHNQHLISGMAVPMNVRYCNDNPACAEAAKTFSFFKEA